MQKQPGTDTDLSRYQDDVRTIKEVLLSVERQPLFEHWVFYTWGVILVVGAVIHFMIARYLDWIATDEFVRLWVPLIVFGMGLEMTAYVLNIRRNDLPFWSRDFVRIVVGLVGSSVVLIFLVLMLFAAGVAHLVPTVLLLGLAVCFFLFGQHPSYAHLTYIAFIGLVAAVVLYFIRPDPAVAGLLCGAVAGLSMIIAGAISGRALHTV